MNKKVTTVALAGLMAVSGVAEASNARWNGLGLINTFVADVQDIWTLPTALLDNGDSLYAEFGIGDEVGDNEENDTYNLFDNDMIGGDQSYMGGVHFGLAGGQVGLWTGRTIDSLFGFELNVANDLGSDDFFSGLSYNFDNLNTKEDIAIFYGMNVNDTTQFTVGLHRWSDVDFDFTDDDEGGDLSTGSNKASGFGVSLGLGLSEAGPLAGLWAGISYTGVSLKEEYTNDGRDNAFNKEDSSLELSGMDINVRVAGEIAGEGDWSNLFDVNIAYEKIDGTMLAQVDGNDGNGSYVADDFEIRTDETKNNRLALNLGVAKMKSGEAGFGAAGLLFGYSSESYEYLNTADATGEDEDYENTDLSGISLKWAAGGEIKAKEWLTLRAGVEGDILSSFTETNTDNSGAPGEDDDVWETKSGTSGATVSAGFGVGMGDFLFDVVLNQDFLYAGPYFLSGAASGLGMEVSLTYGFGGAE